MSDEFIVLLYIVFQIDLYLDVSRETFFQKMADNVSRETFYTIF